MAIDNTPTLVITIKGALSPADSQLITNMGAQLAASGLAVSAHRIDGADRIYIGSRPDKRARLEAIQSLPENLTATQIAARLGLTERQVYRYRALLKQLAGPGEG